MHLVALVVCTASGSLLCVATGPNTPDGKKGTSGVKRGRVLDYALSGAADVSAGCTTMQREAATPTSDSEPGSELVSPTAVTDGDAQAGSVSSLPVRKRIRLTLPVTPAGGQMLPSGLRLDPIAECDETAASDVQLEDADSTVVPTCRTTGSADSFGAGTVPSPPNSPSLDMVS